MTAAGGTGGAGGKNPGAAALGRRGGLVRNSRKGMGSATAEQRAERARVMVEAKRVKREQRERERAGGAL